MGMSCSSFFKGGKQMKISKRDLLFLLIIVLGSFVSGCDALLVRVGKSATIEDTGFFSNYDGLAAATDADKKAYHNLPDLYYISPKINMKAYKKVIVTDFTSHVTDINSIPGLQNKYYKTIRKDLADNIAESVEGSAFDKVVRISEKIDTKDIEAIKKLSADAVLMGNIKEMVAPSVGEGKYAALAAIQVEYKLIDIKTGEEVLKAIHRSTTDKQKVAEGQITVLFPLLNKAKDMPQN